MFKFSQFIIQMLKSILLVYVCLIPISYAASPPAVWQANTCIGKGSKCTPAPITANKASKYRPGFYMRVGAASRASFNQIENNNNFVGIQKVYYWSDLEPELGVYDFSVIAGDLDYAKSIGKQLIVELGATTYNGAGQPHIPKFMWSDSSYGGGPDYYGTFQRLVGGGGWVPVFWNDKIIQRFSELYTKLGEAFDSNPTFEALVIDETSVGGPGVQGFSPTALLNAFKANALSAKTAFPTTTVLQMVNFAPYDLQAFIAWLVDNNIGISCPDIFVDKSTHLNIHTDVYDSMVKYKSTVPIAPMVQGGNFSTYNSQTQANQTVSEMLSFVTGYIKPDYSIWVAIDPIFTDEVVPAINNFAASGGKLGQ